MKFRQLAAGFVERVKLHLDQYKDSDCLFRDARKLSSSPKLTLSKTAGCRASLKLLHGANATSQEGVCQIAQKELCRIIQKVTRGGVFKLAFPYTHDKGR
jgi:hypothetical protein